MKQELHHEYRVIERLGKHIAQEVMIDSLIVTQESNPRDTQAEAEADVARWSENYRKTYEAYKAREIHHGHI